MSETVCNPQYGFAEAAAALRNPSSSRKLTAFVQDLRDRIESGVASSGQLRALLTSLATVACVVEQERDVAHLEYCRLLARWIVDTRAQAHQLLEAARILGATEAIERLENQLAHQDEAYAEVVIADSAFPELGLIKRAHA